MNKFSMKYLWTWLFIFMMENQTMSKENAECLIGVFSSNHPQKGDVLEFKNAYGKKPAVVMFFIGWPHFMDPQVLQDIREMNCVPMITWEPWNMESKTGIDYEALLSGKDDRYIREFCHQIKAYQKTVWLRFAHEMNGNWYPWSGVKIGIEKYLQLYRYMRDFFNKEQCDNVKWIFSINKDSVPSENNHFSLYYPGDAYVDLIGIDGYNWGSTESWSRWESFEDLFGHIYKELTSTYPKPILISEFSSTSQGGNKALWIAEGLAALKRMPRIKAFVLFNIVKETDWSFPSSDECGKEFKKMIQDDYFKENPNERE